MECIKPLYLHSREMTVPCGRCAFCAATLRSDWALRLHYESRKFIGSKFVTLTYADSNLSWAHGSPQLVKSDLQNFFKRLRKSGHKCRYFAVGEYGSQTYRPHYHIILFGDVPDVAIRKAWARCNRSTGKFYGLGLVHIGQVTQASIMYCLGYVVNGKSWKMRKGRVRPFTVMSRRPGIGANYLSKAMIRWHKSERKNYAVLDNVKRHLPRYYKERIFSRIDRVRIAVRDQKAAIRRLADWVRSPAIAKMDDPVSYRDEQMRRLAKSIRFKSKENLII